MSNTESDLTPLDALFEEVSREQPQSPYEKFFLLSNPFPAAGQFIPDICVDQTDVKAEFARTLRELYTSHRSVRMTIIGITGAGKTNILRHFEQRLKEAAISDLFSVFVQEPQGSYFQVHRQLVSQIGALFYTEFFEAVHSRKINLTTLPAELSGLNPELIRVLEQTSIRHRSGTLFGPDIELIRTLDNWLQGVKLSPAEKKRLGGVSVEIGNSATVAVKILSDLIRIFRHAQLFRGLIILFDEFEEILAGITAISQSQYAQNLRNLFDSLPEGVMFVVATAPLSNKLEQISPALVRRLGENVNLQAIQNEESALEYAREYIHLGREVYKVKLRTKITLARDIPTTDRDFYPLKRSEIIEVFNALQTEEPNVIPGDFLPALNIKLYRLAYGEQ